MNYLLLGGIGSQAAAVAGALYKLEKKQMQYDVVIANNTSSLLALSYALKHDLSEIIKASSFTKIGRKNPFRFGRLDLVRAAFSIAKGGSGIMSSHHLKKVYSQLITESDFQEYQEMYTEGIAPRVGVVVYNNTSHGIALVYADTVDYESWINWVVAACTMPGFMKMQKFWTHDFCTAISRVDAPSMYVYAGMTPVAPQNILSITEVYGRPQVDVDYPINIIPQGKRSLGHMMAHAISASYQVSAMNRFYTMTWCKKNQVEYNCISPSNSISCDPFDFTENSLFNQFSAGYSGAENIESQKNV